MFAARKMAAVYQAATVAGFCKIMAQQEGVGHEPCAYSHLFSAQGFAQGFAASYYDIVLEVKEPDLIIKGKVHAKAVLPPVWDLW
jgi:hypothetical protein